MAWVGNWEGGRCWEGKDGRVTYFIRREVNGKLYEVSTRAHTLRAALAHLQRFEADPSAYRAEAVEGDKVVTLSDDLIEEFSGYCVNEKGNTPEWVQKKRRYLEWWQTKLGKRDLRHLILRTDLTPPLKGTPSRRHK
ncbi:MAG TPA: hypothetical protein VMK12_10165, partial [Anaeromyxobacteraceae bacterium]|nr:hypothetical protein [Anaeromyxobacteraceae bacterium]